RNGAEFRLLRYDAYTDPIADADVWIIRPVDLARFASAKQLLPLPEAYTASNGPYQWDKLLPLYGEKLTVWERIKYAMPLLGEAPLCFYRSDLFNAADHQNAYQKLHGRKLAAPATWQEFEAIASFFKGRAGLAQATLAPLSAADEELDREFFTVAASFARQAAGAEDAVVPRDVEMFSFHYDKETLLPRIDQPGLVAALELLKRLQALRPDRSADEPPVAFSSGQAVLCLAEAAWIARFQDKGSLIRGKFDCCRLPGSSVFFDYRSGERRSAGAGNYV